MNRKKVLVIIFGIFTLVVILVVGGYIYFTNTKITPKKELPGGEGFIQEPGSDTSSTNSSSTSTTSINTGTSTSVIIPRIRQITTTPVAGYDFIDTSSKGYKIWYVDRETGHTFQTATNTLDVSPVTETTIPRVYEAYFSKGGSHIILRTLKNDLENTIETFIGTPTQSFYASSTDIIKQLKGIFTSDTLSFISLSPTKDSFFGINTNGIGSNYDWNARSINLFSHPLKKWIPQWINQNIIVMTSAPSSKNQNITYFLNPKTKSLTKVLGPKNGLVVSSSPSGSFILFSENKSKNLHFGIYDTKLEKEIALSEPTIADKCIWSKKNVSLAYCGFPKNNTVGNYPDDWYQGKTLFNDTLKALNITTSQLDTISDFEAEINTPIDFYQPILSNDEKYVLFTNKRDLTLWMIEL